MASTASLEGGGGPSLDAEWRVRRSSIASIVLPGIRPQRACAARGVPGREAASDKVRVEAALDERLRHVAPDVEAVGAINGHRLVRRQLGDPLLDAIRIAPRRARHQIEV